MAGDVGPYGNYILAGIFFLVGLYLLEIISLPFFQKPDQPGVKRKGLWAAFVLGLLFGIALGPRTFAYMAPMLAVAFTMGASRFLRTVITACLCGGTLFGHCWCRDFH